ncbi:MAG: AAA family ATPase [Synergistaceae bacterium]|nr:AAA family ATPase [Synergistaceae bacterium]
MEHFIKEIRIDNVRHLKDIRISLDSDHRQHLILTGKNGSGKTSVLDEIANNLMVLNMSTGTDLLEVRRQLRQDMNLLATEVDERKRAMIEKINSLREVALSSCPITGLDVIYNHEEDLPILYSNGEFITAFFAATRPSNDIIPAHVVEDIRLPSSAGVREAPARDIMKYMVHLKTQQSYAKNENDTQNERYIGEWFDRFEKALRTLLDDDSIELKYDYKNYNFVIHQKNRNPSSLNELSDGYSSILRILSDLIMRMDQNWLHKNQLSEYNKEGVVLIDEVETHLHIELQRKILPFLTKFFPRLQFIVSTHSPYVLTSLSNVVVYDLERQVMLRDLSEYSTDDVANGFFEAESYSVELEATLNRYKELLLKPDISDDERAERADLRIKLKNIPGEFGRSIRAEFDTLEQERQR